MAHGHDEQTQSSRSNPHTEIAQQVLAEVPSWVQQPPWACQSFLKVHKVPGISRIDHHIRLRRGGVGNDDFVVLITLWRFFISPKYKIFRRDRGEFTSIESTTGTKSFATKKALHSDG